MDFLTANITLVLIAKINTDPNLTDKQKVAMTRNALEAGRTSSLAA